MERHIVHCDLDTFFVSVERLVNSDLVGKPVLIGGNGDRGVVASCSYEARKYGVHSAMPMKLALRMCPEAVVVRGDHDLYSKYSGTVTEIIEEVTPIVEKASIDEHYLDITGMDKFFGCWKWTQELRGKIIKETGLPISFGLSINKTVSKIATGEAKPCGEKQVAGGTEKRFLAPLSIRKIPMVGEKSYLTLRNMGISHIETLQQMEVFTMRRVLGENGVSIWTKANGIDNSAVVPFREQKSMSKENTFLADTIDMDILRKTLVAMVDELAYDLRSQQKLTGCITLKIRYSNFDTHTQQLAIPYTNSDRVITDRVLELFKKLYSRRMLIRLIGVKFSKLIHGSYQVDLFNDTLEEIRLMQAVDRIRNRYGVDLIKKVSVYWIKKEVRMMLNVHSYFSLRYGTLSLEDLVEGLLAGGHDTAVLTDINNSSGSLDFLRLGMKAGLNVLSGMEFRNGDRLLYIGIARNNEGFRQLNELMTASNKEATTLPEVAPYLDQVYFIYPYGSSSVKELRENEYIGIRPIERNLIRLEAAANWERYVILAPVSFIPEDYKLHCQLRAIDHNILFSQLERQMVADKEEVLLPKVKLLELYRDFPMLIRNTNRLLASCSFDLDFKKMKNKASFTGNPVNDKQLLHKYTLDGFRHRYGRTDKVAMERIKRELEIIENLNFSSYYLITDDICRYARGRDFHYVGRGSGANSAVAYCLGITDVDPIELKLPFERFLNPKRQSPPDFDIDFSWNERDDIYDYIFNRYQTGHTALMGAMSTFRSRSILRELGKVYGLPKAEIDRLVHEPEHMLNKNEVTNTILSVYNRMADFPNQRTIHPSGVLISELPLTYYSALDYPPKGLPTMQFDMYVSEDIGFEKFDILSQRGIGHIKDCREIVKLNRGVSIDTSNPKRFFEDPKIADQLRSANTIGCFYIESPAMRQLITKLRCDDYLTLVAASSIIRPGVASSGMMAEFIKRHHNPETVVYPHPVFKEQLEETYGVMVYQEDVMKIGHAYGGLDMSDADVLRRMMSGKYRNKEHLLEIEDKFFDHCRAQGYPEAASREIWRQMESFAGYSFNKAHSASFAVESYQSLFLKTYYPKEFMVAVLNNYGGFYNRKVYVNEAKRAGAAINLPCVNRSTFVATIYGDDIFLGFDCLQNLNDKLALRIPSERLANGNYTSLENFVLRTGARLEQLIILIRTGAFRFMGLGKKELLWEAHLLLSKDKRAETVPLLFETTSRKPVLPKLQSSVLEDYYDEIELIGFGVSGSLFDLARSDYRGDVKAAELMAHEGKTIRMVGDFVAEKYVRTKNDKLMKFGTFLDMDGDFFDTVHFPPSLAKSPLRGNGLYLIEGKVVVEFGCPAIDVSRCGKMALKADPRSI